MDLVQTLSKPELRPHATRSLRSEVSGGSREENSLSSFDARRIHEYRETTRNARDVQFFRPKPMGWFSVFCVIANRMIGSGIFKTPDVVVKETHSIMTAILFWIFGAIIAISGTLVYIEFGLAIPRLFIQGGLESVPANGGEKNYLEYVYNRPRRLATCLYGIPFIFFGNMAGNAILFGESIYVACANKEPENGVVRGIAIGISTLACFMHVYSRHLGILFNNIFGTIKVLILLMFIVVGIIAFANALPIKSAGTAKDNYTKHNEFGTSPNGTYGYTSSFLAIIFAYGGFNQANYILGNMKQPRRRFKWTALTTVITISVLYIALNLCFYGVVPYDQLIDGNTQIATAYFGLTLSQSQSTRVAAAFTAFSSLGNIIIQTFTASRVKQELAKEGILPWSRFFASNRTWHWRFWQRTNAEDETAEATPFGALLLHWAFSILLILGTYTLTPSVAYSTYVGIYSFAIDAFFGFCVGLGLLVLRLSDLFTTNTKTTKWSTISTENKYTSMIAASIFTVANLYPLVAIWLAPPPGKPQASGSTVPFWVTGTIGFATVLAGFVYWMGLEGVYPWLAERRLEVERRPVTSKDGGEFVVVNEIVCIDWVVDER